MQNGAPPYSVLPVGT